MYQPTTIRRSIRQSDVKFCGKWALRLNFTTHKKKRSHRLVPMAPLAWFQSNDAPAIRRPCYGVAIPSPFGLSTSSKAGLIVLLTNALNND